MKAAPPSDRTGPLADDTPDSERFDPRELLRIATLHRWLIVTLTALAVLVTAVFTFTATPYFRAKARVLIERSQNNTVAFQEIYQLGTGTDDYYLTQHKILESRAVASVALASLPPTDQAWFQEQKPSDPVAGFMKLVEIQPVLKSRLVDVAADNPDPAVARRMAEAVVAAYIQNGLDRQNDASSVALTKLQKDAEDLQAKLMTAEKAMQEFKTRNEIVSMNDRQSLTAARLEKLNDELAEIERTRNEAQARLQSAEQIDFDNAVDADLPEALVNPVIADCKRALMTTKAELSQLEQTYKPKHPNLLAIHGKIAAMEEQLLHEIASVRQGLTNQYERSALREKDVRRRLEVQTKALLELENKAIQFQILKDEADSTRRLHETVVNRLKEVQLIHGAETTNVHRLGEAEVSTRPVRPNKPLNLAIALLAGLLLSFVTAFTIDLCDRTLKGADDISACLGLPPLGLVPRFEDRCVDGTALDPATLDERSAASEAFRTIRTGLVFTEAGRDMRSLLVTSTAPSEGKSTTSINLSVAFARTGKRVLLVDADLRRPRLHKVFNVSDDQGFSNLLIGGCQLQDAVHATEVPNLSFMPCGVIPPNPVELLGGAGMQPAFEQMLATFDMVVFDSPPSGIVSDASVLATIVDRVAFVVRSLRTNRNHARHAVDQLRAVGGHIAGAVVNQSDLRAARYGQYGSYGSYGGYGYTYRSNEGKAAVEAEELVEAP